MENFKKAALIELCFFFIDILAFELGKLCLRVGILISFLYPGSEFCTESCPWGGDFDGKNSGPGVSPGGGW